MISKITKTLIFISVALFLYGCIGSSPVFKSIRHKNVEELRTAINNGGDVNEITKVARATPLYMAIVAKAPYDYEMTKLLLQNGAEVNMVACLYWTPLQAASINNKIEIVKLLLNYNPMVDEVMPLRDQTALDMAIGNGNQEIIDLLRDYRKQNGYGQERPYHRFSTLDAIAIGAGAYSNATNNTNQNSSYSQNNQVSNNTTDPGITSGEINKDNSKILEKEADKAMKRTKKEKKEKYEYYMKLYRQEESEAESYQREYERTGYLSDLNKANDCRERAKKYLELAEIWK